MSGRISSFGDASVLRQSLEAAGSFDLDVWESPTAWPRAFFTDRVGIYDRADDFVAAIKSGDGRPFAALLREDRGLLPKVESALAGRQVVSAVWPLAAGVATIWATLSKTAAAAKRARGRKRKSSMAGPSVAVSTS